HRLGEPGHRCLHAEPGRQLARQGLGLLHPRRNEEDGPLQVALKGGGYKRAWPTWQAQHQRGWGALRCVRPALEQLPVGRNLMEKGKQTGQVHITLVLWR
ncbi:MAG: hypothetical protein C4309_10575, partial [Chloroflexota bacterium]